MTDQDQTTPSSLNGQELDLSGLLDRPESFDFADLAAYADSDAVEERARMRADAADAQLDPNASEDDRPDPYPEWRANVESAVRSIFRLHGALDAPLREVYLTMEESDANWLTERIIGQFEPTPVPSVAAVLRTYLLTRERLGLGPTVAAVLRLKRPQSFLRMLGLFEGLIEGEVKPAQPSQPPQG